VSEITIRRAAAALLLAAATLALYHAVLGHAFVYFDDQLYVTENRNVRAGFRWETILWSLTAYQVGNWHPLTLLSHALDCELFGLAPAGHHFTSLILHATNAVLLFLLLSGATGSPGRSWLVAALFALHPVNVESVAWVSQRKNVLSTLLLLFSLGAWGWYARRPGLARYLCVAALFALGLAAKPMLVTLPFALLLLDLWPLQRIRGLGAPEAGPLAMPRLPLARLVLEKLPLLALAALDIVLTLAAQEGARAIASLEEIPFLVRLETAVYAYGKYLSNALWPTRLTHLYPHPEGAISLAQVASASLLLAAVSALAWVQRRRRPHLLVGWLWFLGTLVPVIGLIQVGEQAMADRFAYVPFLGLFLMAVWCAAELAERFGLRGAWRAALAAAVLAPLCLLTLRQVDHWRDNLSLWRHALEVTTGNHIAEENVALELREQGRMQEALVHFRNAVRIRPGDPVLHLNLAASLGQSGQLEEAIVEYQEALRKAKDPILIAVVHADLGNAYRLRGDRARALEHYQRALEIDPAHSRALRGMRLLEAKAPDAPARIPR
jgi:tetratricopeptide (TPR) repeat protein